MFILTALKISTVDYLISLIRHVLVVVIKNTRSQDCPVLWLMPLDFVIGFLEFHHLQVQLLARSIQDQQCKLWYKTSAAVIY